MQLSTITNKMAQFALLAIFIIYHYKHKTSGAKDSLPLRKLNKMLFKVAIIKETTIGISHLVCF